jgi:hypothetical protein
MMKIFSIFWRIGPVPYDTPARPSHEVNVHFLYPIYYYWIRLINHKVFKKRSLPTFPSCPVLFIYGKAISCSHDIFAVSILLALVIGKVRARLPCSMERNLKKRFAVLKVCIPYFYSGHNNVALNRLPIFGHRRRALGHKFPAHDLF